MHNSPAEQQVHHVPEPSTLGLYIMQPSGRPTRFGEWGSAHRHGEDELEHRHAQRGGVDETAAGQHEVREGALARVAERVLRVHVLVITAEHGTQNGLATSRCCEYCLRVDFRTRTVGGLDGSMHLRMLKMYAQHSSLRRMLPCLMWDNGRRSYI